MMVTFSSDIFNDVKPKLKQLFWPIVASANWGTNQSKFETNTSNRLKARENAGEMSIIVGFAFYWLRKWREFCQQITRVSKSKSTQTWTLN